MSERKFGELRNEEFRALLEQMGEDEATDLPVSTFFEALSALNNAKSRIEKVVELTADIVNGELHFDPASSIPVRNNEIYINDTKVIVKLRYHADAAG